MKVSITAAMGKEYAWLTIGVRLLANRCSYTVIWHHPYHGGGKSFIAGYSGPKSIATLPLHRD